MTTATEPVRLTRAQIREAGEVLAKASHEDPLAVWLVPEEAKRSRLQRWYFPAIIRYGLLYGEVYGTAGLVAGAAIWLPPGETDVTTIRLIRVGFLAAPLRLGPAAFVRSMTVADHHGKLHKRDMNVPHWYLWEMGVAPPRQGQGIGGALMQPILNRADAEGVHCYLETHNERNPPFYVEHGFKVVVEGDIPKGGPHFWTMKREPRG